MARGYWLPHLDVSDPEGYKAYMAAAAEAHRGFDTRLLVRVGRSETMEGALRGRNVLREFASYDDAVACYRSPEYVHARTLRAPVATGDFVIVEGYDGPQPAPIGTPPAPGATKGYWLAHVDVNDVEGYKPYTVANAIPFGKFGGRFLVRGGRHEIVEGHVRSRSVVMEFPSYEVALACYRSRDYQAAIAMRKGKADIDLIVIEGFSGPQH